MGTECNQASFAFQSLGRDRLRRQNKGQALAGRSTLNRLELTPVRANAKSRYNKIMVDRQAARRLFTEVFLQSYERPPKRIVLDWDAANDPIPGNPWGRDFRTPASGSRLNTAAADPRAGSWRPRRVSSTFAVFPHRIFQIPAGNQTGSVF